jgi:uncharacterized RDD family membrane protein YckC
MANENPYEAPSVTEVMAETTQATGELAGLGDRFLGAFIDGLINGAFAIIMALGLIATGFLGSMAEYGQLNFLATLVLTLVGFAFYIGINWKFLSTSGQTIGKRVAKTRIVTMDGRVPSMVDLVGKRYAFFSLIGVIPVVGAFISLANILFIFGRERRCLHDLIAGTRVIKALPGTF